MAEVSACLMTVLGLLWFLHSTSAASVPALSCSQVITALLLFSSVQPGAVRSLTNREMLRIAATATPAQVKMLILQQEARKKGIARERRYQPVDEVRYEERENFSLRIRAPVVFDWRHCLEHIPIDRVNNAVANEPYFRKIATSPASLEELSAETLRLSDGNVATNTTLDFLKHTPFKAVVDMIRKINKTLTTIDLADILNWYHAYSLPESVRRQPVFLISRFVLDRCNLLSSTSTSESRFFEELLKLQPTVLVVGPEGLNTVAASRMKDAVWQSLVYNLFSFHCSDFDPPLGIPRSPRSIDHHISVVLTKVYRIQAFADRVITFGGRYPRVVTYRSSVRDGKFLLARYEHLDANFNRSKPPTGKHQWEIRSAQERPVNGAEICLRCADNCTHRPQEALILATLRQNFNVSVLNWLDGDCKPTLFLGFSHTPDDIRRPVMRHTQAIYDVDEVLMLTRKPFATPPQNDVGESLTASFRCEMLLVTMAVLLLAIAIAPSFRSVLGTFCFLLSMLYQPQGLARFRGIGLRRRALLCAWTVAATLTVTEWNSQLLFVLQNPRVHHFGGETLLNTTEELNEAVRSSSATLTTGSRRIQRNVSSSSSASPFSVSPSSSEIVCFVDEASTMFLAAENFNIPLDEYNRENDDLAAILRVSRSEWLEAFRRSYASAAATAVKGSGQRSSRSLSVHSLRAKRIRFVTSMLCGIHDAELYIRAYRRSYKRDPVACVRRWQRRQSYPFGLRKVIQRGLGHLNVSSYVEHVFSPAIASLSIYPTSDASSPYAGWFDVLFTRLTEVGLFHKPHRDEFLSSYHLQVAIMNRDDWSSFKTDVTLFSAEKLNRRCSYTTITVAENPELFWFVYVVGAASLVIALLEKCFSGRTCRALHLKASKTTSRSWRRCNNIK